MTASDDIRWQQRLANFGKALARLSEAVELAQAVTDDIAQRACGQYQPLFIAFHKHMQMLAAAR